MSGMRGHYLEEGQWLCACLDMMRQRYQDQQANELIAEVDRAIDNLAKSGKMFPNMPGPGRRESMPMSGGGGPARAFSEQYGKGHNPIKEAKYLFNV